MKLEKYVIGCQLHDGTHYFLNFEGLGVNGFTWERDPCKADMWLTSTRANSALKAFKKEHSLDSSIVFAARVLPIDIEVKFT